MAKKASGKTSGKAEANVLRSRDIGARQQTFRHPWNPNSEITGVQLGVALGLKRVGVSIARREVKLIDHPEPRLSRPDEVKIRILEVGVCGTDREICEFKFGEPPSGSDYLVLGHEALGEVIEVGPGVQELRPGSLVVPMVRLPCTDPACAACRSGRQDFCLTDTFPEHGIRRSHGFMAERIFDTPS